MTHKRHYESEVLESSRFILDSPVPFLAKDRLLPSRFQILSQLKVLLFFIPLSKFRVCPRRLLGLIYYTLMELGRPFLE